MDVTHLPSMFRAAGYFACGKTAAAVFIWTAAAFAFPAPSLVGNRGRLECTSTSKAATHSCFGLASNQQRQ